LENCRAFHIEYRQEPINIIEKDKLLFKHEYEYKCYEPILKIYKNTYFNSEGFIYQFFRPVIEPFSIKNKSHKKSNLDTIKNIFKCYLLKQGDLNDPCFFIHDVWFEGYFHWNLDALPRLYCFLQLQSTKYKLILPKYSQQFSYITESLALLGFNNNNCIYVDYSRVYYAKEIATCPPFTHTGNYHSEVIRSMTKQLKTNAGVSSQPANRLIYVSRKNAKKRKIINEEEISGILQRLGFEIIETDNLSYVEQIQLFNSVKWLVSIHGAGLSNMIFMNKGCHVLELRNKDDKTNNCYFSLASAVGLHYYYLENNTDNSNTNVGNLFIDPQKFEEVLQKYVVIT
jgi:hypothetical protein